MREILSNKKRGFLFGNEAVVRGALESGVGYAASYPGTPASEIGDCFAKIAKERGIYFEWSTNEKVALESAAGAAFSGVKSIVGMKHYGLNVALDTLCDLGLNLVGDKCKPFWEGIFQVDDSVCREVLQESEE